MCIKIVLRESGIPFYLPENQGNLFEIANLEKVGTFIFRKVIKL